MTRLPDSSLDRRKTMFALVSMPLVLGGCSLIERTPGRGGDEEDEAEVTPGEDLMQEHGLLERILLVYEAVARRIESKEDFDRGIVGNAAGIVRTFVEDYHERNEEQHVFPRLLAAKREVELVTTLLKQHAQGRVLTDEISRLAAGPTSGDPELLLRLSSFVRMYRPHAAREDTVLFPAFRRVVHTAEYLELGRRFEEDEHAKLGAEGFEGAVDAVARLERALGVDALDAFSTS